MCCPTRAELARATWRGSESSQEGATSEKALPRYWLVPDLVTTLTTPPMAPPYSAAYPPLATDTSSRKASGRLEPPEALGRVLSTSPSSMPVTLRPSTT